jgi:hypothetical protein
LHILSVLDVELTGLHPSLLVRKRRTQERILIGLASRESSLLIGKGRTELGIHVELTSLKLGSNIALLTLDVSTQNIRGKLLAHLLGPKELLVDLLRHRQILSRTLTGSSRTGKSLTRNGSVI